MREKRTGRTARTLRRDTGEQLPFSGTDTVTYVVQMETRWGAPHFWITLLALAVLGVRALGAFLDRRDRPRA